MLYNQNDNMYKYARKLEKKIYNFNEEDNIRLVTSEYLINNSEFLKLLSVFFSLLLLKFLCKFLLALHFLDLRLLNNSSLNIFIFTSYRFG